MAYTTDMDNRIKPLTGIILTMLVMIASGLFNPVFAQERHKRYTASSGVKVSSGEVYDQASAFIFSDNSISWIHGVKGRTSRSFMVEQIIRDSNKTIYKVKEGVNPGVITFTAEGAEMFISISIDEGESESVFEFTVTSDPH